MDLMEAIKTAGNDSQWGIYADVPFSAESEARFGQEIFENGGLLDDKQWVCTCESANYRSTQNLIEYLDHEDYDEMLDENIADFLIPELEAERQEREDIDAAYDLD